MYTHHVYQHHFNFASIASFSDHGKGENWDTAENEALARAWVAASEDTITGTNQTSKRFIEAIHHRFIEKGPTSGNVPAGKYGNRSPASCKAHFDNISADAQKFFVSLRKVRACSPTGVTDDNILSMAVAIHVDKTNTMDYKYKDFDKDSWSVFRAWKVLKTRPKWSQTFFQSEEPRNQSSNQATSGAVLQESEDEDVSIQKVGQEASNCLPQTFYSGGDALPKMERRFRIGARNAKIVRQEELRTQAVRSMAESAKRKSTALEERNAKAVFSRPEAANLPESTEFFRAMRQTYLAQALKRARQAHEEVLASSATTTPQEASDLLKRFPTRTLLV